MVYLDNAATTRIDDSVLDEMMPYLKDEYGNPGSLHSAGRKTKLAINEARKRVKEFIGAEDEQQVLFTSGGTEANNLVLHSMAERFRDYRPHIIVSSVEHDSVWKTARKVSIANGFDISEVPVNRYGTVESNTVLTEIRPNTKFISVMMVNNEVGTRNPVEEIGAICRAKGILFHTDAVQAAGTFDIDVEKIGCDFLSISSHKLHGPKGVGALYARDLDKLRPMIIGGVEQEFGKRGGTENVAGIVGLGSACLLEHSIDYVSTLKQTFYSSLKDEMDKRGIDNILHLNGGSVLAPGKILNIRFDGIDSETLILVLESRGIMVSAGSACRSHESEPSRVLLAMGLTPTQARSSIRVSFSKFNTEDEVLCAASETAQCVEMLLR